MGLCFCSRPSMGMSPSDDEHRPPLLLSTSAMPVAPRPARLPRLVAEDPEDLPVVPPRTPPRLPHMHDCAISPRQPSVHCPIPDIPDFQGLAENESDSDDELFQFARMRAAASGTIAPGSPVPSMPASSTAGVADGTTTSLSPLSSLISRIGSIGRTSPSRPPLPCRSPEAACSTEDLAAAAHRAEVRRLMHKMMQDELQSEQQRQHKMQQMHPPRTYKRSSMSTIKEDPADVSGADLIVPVPHAVVATLDGSGPREPPERVFTKSREDLTLPSVLAQGRKADSKFVLSKPPALPAPVSSRSSSSSSSVLQRGRGMLPHGIATIFPRKKLPLLRK
ncbi:MAG: hypothetical protein STHCBS139747_004215 [Sporothrix thermara]